ncbi:hypothetical protein ES703_105162 [subsurface metagenome]
MRSRAKNLLERVGLEKHRDHFPAQLSGGEMQRVAVIRALINRPKLILADEPTGSLDRESSENLGQLLVKVPTNRLTRGFFFRTVLIFSSPLCKPEMDWLICLLVTNHIVKNATTAPINAPRSIEENLK